ncbi:Kelch repeat-containing protein [Flexithrix dorotheae]|uniref:Kelch repeat-containing protein n=1 Tax=Flexithrix dorotheae TaxID=70993 RepID=UPI000379DEE9|nr:kelch repeat-containing protein [Flexithrix dorotheae]
MNSNCRILFVVFTLFVNHFLFAQGWEKIELDTDGHKRHESSFVQVGDKFIAVGGRGLKPVDIYDINTKTWSTGKQPPIEMHHFQAASHNGLLYVMGAFNGGYPYETPIPNIFIYDPLQDLWTVGPKIPAHRQRGAAGVAVYNGKFYLLCGIVNGHSSNWVSWLDEFDPATNTWKELPDAPRERDHFHAAVIDGKLYAAGGRKSGFGKTTFLSTTPEVDVYDFEKGYWSTLPSPEGDIPTQRAGTTVAVHDGNLFVLGGESGSQQKAHSDFEMLDTDNQSWVKLDSIITGRHGTQAIYSNNAIYLEGGCANRGGSPEITNFEVYYFGEKNEPVGKAIEKGKISSDKTSIDFAEVNTESKKSIEIHLKHSEGNQAVVLMYAIITGAQGFEVELKPKLPLVLNPGTGATIPVIFKPKSKGDYEAQLVLKTLGKDEPIFIQLNGKGK